MTRNKGYAGGISYRSKLSLEDCKATCVYDMRCTSVDYKAATEKCSLHRRIYTQRRFRRIAGSINYAMKRCVLCPGNVNRFFWNGLWLGTCRLC